jgi:predicted protein tyrosine phosphatase
MEIFVSSARNVYWTICTHNITHVITLLMPKDYFEFKLPVHFNKANHLYLIMDDKIDAAAENAPTKSQINCILTWANNLPKNAKLLVHCYAGISRSTAVALAIKVQNDGLDKIEQSVDWLVNHRSIACPNPVICQYADELLGANGKFFECAEALAKSKMIMLNSGLKISWREMLST